MPPNLTLDLLPQTLAVARLNAADALPDWAQGGALLSIVRTPEELSIVVETRFVPDSVRAERGFRSLRVRGLLDFSLTGILNSLTGPLARAGVSLFAISTFDTDYLLVREQDLSTALCALKEEGHAVHNTET